MPYRVLRPVDVKTLNGRDHMDATDEDFEAGLNQLENEGYLLVAVVPPDASYDQLKLVFHQPDPL